MQVNKIETTKKLKMLDIQTEMLKTSKKKYEITDKEVGNLSPDTRFSIFYIHQNLHMKWIFRKQISSTGFIRQ